MFGNASYLPMYSDSGSARIPSNSSSNVLAQNCPRTMHTLSAVERQMLALAQSSGEPLNATFPSDTAMSSPPIFFTSKERVFSMPKWQGAMYL